jgi:hypothetical protein
LVVTLSARGDVVIGGVGVGGFFGAGVGVDIGEGAVTIGGRGDATGIGDGLVGVPAFDGSCFRACSPNLPVCTASRRMCSR